MTCALDSTFARTVISVYAWISFAVLLIGLVLSAIIRLVTMPFVVAPTGLDTFRSVARMHGRLNPLWTFTVRGDFPENPVCRM